MRVHRTTPTRGYTPLRNTVLRDHRLSLTARGLLGDIISRKDGAQVDIKSLSAENPDGQAAISRAFHELVEHGYVVRRRVRNRTTRRIITVTHVYDTPQDVDPADDLSLVVEGLDIPSFEPESAEDPSPHPSGEKNGENNPPSPVPQAEPEPELAEGRGDEISEEETPEQERAVAALADLGRRAPRLALGRREMKPLLPLVAEWFERGATAQQLFLAMTEGLPLQVHSPKALLKHRLAEKLPPAPILNLPTSATVAALPECDDCGRPVKTPGRCGHCAPAAAPTAPPVSSARERALAAARDAKIRAKYAHAG